MPDHDDDVAALHEEDMSMTDATSAESTEPAPDDDPPAPDDDLPDTQPLPAPEVRPKLGLREYLSLAQLSPVANMMMQTWMQRSGYDIWGHYDKAEWDTFVTQAKTYVPRV